jgi:hypothetical protein
MLTEASSATSWLMFGLGRLSKLGIEHTLRTLRPFREALTRTLTFGEARTVNYMYGDLRPLL